MPITQVSVNANVNFNQVLLETHNALAMTVAGNETPPVEIVRDSNGKLTSLLILFPDAVVENEQAAAIEKIARNSGVSAVVTEPPLVFSENFDAFAAGILSSITLDPRRAVHFTAAGLRLNTTCLGGVGTRIATNEIDGVLSNSAPNSLKQKVVASGTSTNFRMSTSGEADILPGQGATINAFRYRFAIRLPTDFLDKAPAGREMIVEIRIGRVLKNTSGGRANFILRFEALSDPVTPGTELVGSLVVPVATGGTISNLVLPLDNAWHVIELVRVENVGGEVAWTVSVDATSESFVFSGHVSMTVPTSFNSQTVTFSTFDAPFTLDHGFDDIEVAYTLA